MQLKSFFLLVFVLIIYSCKEPVQQFDPSIHKAEATFDYNSSDWQAEARVKSFRSIAGIDFVQIQLDFTHSDEINIESLRFFIPKGENGSSFMFSNNPPGSIFITDEAFPYAMFFTFEPDVITECYVPYNEDENENFIHIDEINDQGEYTGRFQVSFALDSLSRGIERRIRLDTFSLINGTFTAFSEL